MCKVYKYNILAIKHPELINEWHPTKNGNLTPWDVPMGSGIKVWWKCKNNHEWKVSINNRHNGNKCPYCSNKKACNDNCLATINPKLAKEWHPTKNGNLTPFDILPNSRKKIWWKCKNGHEWQSTADSRSSGVGCPYFSNKRACDDNCLATINPELAKEWHLTKNGNLTPRDVVQHSNKKVWWKCKKCNFDWQAKIVDRNLNINNCKNCKSLAVKNPKLSKEWHPTKNGKLTPFDISTGSGIKAWWKCKKGHEWKAVVGSRNSGINCPYCSNRYPTKENNFKAKMPHLIKEWHLTKNGNLKPENFCYKSDKKIWWICEKGHEWKTTLKKRSIGRGCPECNSNKSLGEEKIKKFFKKNKIKFSFQKSFKECINKNKLSFDFYIEEKNLLIEYDGQHHFKPIRFGGISLERAKKNLEKQKIKDEIKNVFVKNNDIKMLRIPYTKFDDIEKILKKELLS